MRGGSSDGIISFGNLLLILHLLFFHAKIWIGFLQFCLSINYYIYFYFLWMIWLQLNGGDDGLPSSFHFYELYSYEIGEASWFVAILFLFLNSNPNINCLIERERVWEIMYYSMCLEAGMFWASSLHESYGFAKGLP